MEKGTVKWFNNERGYGFITKDSGGEIFVHYKGIMGDHYKTLLEGQRVEFSETSSPKGKHAINVKVML